MLIKNTKKTDMPTGVATLLDIVTLKTPVLTEGNPLRIQSPRKKLAVDAQHHPGTFGGCSGDNGSAGRDEAQSKEVGSCIR